MRLIPRLVGLLLVTVVLAGCGLPYDAENSYNKAREGVLRVGKLKAEPRAEKVIADFAKSIEAEIEYYEAPPRILHQALKECKLDLVYGELDASSPFLRGVAQSRPYQTSRFVVTSRSVEPSEELLQEKGVSLEEPDDELMALIISGKKPNPSSPLRLEEIEGEETVEGAMDVRKPDKFVLALPPGENRLLVEVDRFLESNS